MRIVIATGGTVGLAEGIIDDMNILYISVFPTSQGVRKEDGGFYICRALSVAGSSVTKAYLEVTAIEDQPPPIIEMGPANQTLPVGTIAVLPCQAFGNPKPSIKWMKNGERLNLGSSSRIVIEKSGTLVIDSKLFPIKR